MHSYTPRQIGIVTLAAAAGIAGATVISDASVHRLGLWGIPLGLLVASVSIVLFGLLSPYRDRMRVKLLRGMIALIFVADVACLSAPLLGAADAAVVLFWRRWGPAAHIIAILIVAFEADAFLLPSREK